jgi:hypothetical protein
MENLKDNTMMKYLYITTIVLVTSCGQKNNDFDKKKVIHSDPVSNTSITKFKLEDKTVKFLWRADKYDAELKDTFNSIFINEDFCKTITDPERAALGYVATFIGNECWWDAEPKDDRSNLKCKY